MVSRTGAGDQSGQARSHREVFWLEDAVGIAERAAAHDVRGQLKVGRTETWRPADEPSAEVERTVLWPCAWRFVVVGAAEHAALPPPPVAALVRGEAVVACTGLELRAVDTVAGHRRQYRHGSGRRRHQPVGVKLQGHPPRWIARFTRSESGDVSQCPLPSGRAVHAEQYRPAAHVNSSHICGQSMPVSRNSASQYGGGSWRTPDPACALYIGITSG